jgi:hypothetical protein
MERSDGVVYRVHEGVAGPALPHDAIHFIVEREMAGHGLARKEKSPPLETHFRHRYIDSAGRVAATRMASAGLVVGDHAGIRSRAGAR